MNFKQKYPPLYECSVCGKPVKVIPQGEGVEPIKKFKCEHTNAIIWANRRVTLRGKGKMSVVKKAKIKITLTLRQLLCALTGRSI
jgi:hypothetical protein